jgi:hypothetical protein
MVDEHNKQGPRDADHPPHGHRDRDSSHELPRKGDKKIPADKGDPDAAGPAGDDTYHPRR